MMGPVKLPFYARLALTLLALVLVFVVLSAGSNIFIPLVFGLLIAILLYPLNRFFEHRLHLGRTASPMLCVVLFISAMGGFIYFLARQLIIFSDDLPLLRQRFQEMFGDLQHWLSYKMHINTRQQTHYINQSMNSLLDTAAHSVRNVVFSVTGVLLLMIFIFIFTFFILFHRKLLMKFVLHLFSVQHRSKVSEVVMETKSMINAYVMGLVIEMVVLSIVCSAMFLIMGIRYAILLAVITALLNIIPYLGIYTAMAMCMLVTFANSNSHAAVAVGIGLLIVHVLDANVLFPRIVGGRVKMNPFITIIAVIVGEYLWGIPGMFLFIPIVGIIKLICERVDGLEAWGYLIGVEETPKTIKKVKVTE